jgi:periplasmic divalent cation tolerance protein
MSFLVVFITAPGETEAERIARVLVEEKMAACVNIVRNVRSIYCWQGKVEDEAEVLMVCKTRAELFEDLQKRVKEIHPYTVPEIIALPVAAGSADYLAWLNDVTR